jgi:hypothetical protein
LLIDSDDHLSPVSKLTPDVSGDKFWTHPPMWPGGSILNHSA